MANTDDENQKNLPFNLIENPIVTHPQAVKLVFAFELLDTRWIWIVRQRVDPSRDSATYRNIKCFKVTLGSRGKFNPVGQLHAQFFLDLVPRHRALFLGLCQRGARFIKIDFVF